MNKVQHVVEHTCPRCQTSTYSNPNMKLLVNVCGHKLCEVCVDAVFTRPTAPCPQCSIPLRRSLFRVQQFEDAAVEKEVDIRKRILKDYNKREEDFNSLEEYNDYLEEVETIVYNLTYGIDEEETRLKIESYRKENKTLIMKNRAKQSREAEIVNAQLQLETTEAEERRQRTQQIEEQINKNKKKTKELLIDELMKSSRPAEEVIAQYTATMKQDLEQQQLHDEASQPAGKPLYSTEQVGQVVFEPLSEIMEIGELYHYSPLTFDLQGPSIPLINEIERLNCPAHCIPLEETRRGGGFTQVQACRRLLEDAYTCLLFDS